MPHPLSSIMRYLHASTLATCLLVTVSIARKILISLDGSLSVACKLLSTNSASAWDTSLKTLRNQKTMRKLDCLKLTIEELFRLREHIVVRDKLDRLCNWIGPLASAHEHYVVVLIIDVKSSMSHFLSHLPLSWVSRLELLIGILWEHALLHFMAYLFMAYLWHIYGTDDR